jgi:basic membrane lipoprotein Med (substrate-binding protein (PBP1-ABC) superfamily)/DNA-binding SARP family transcriptional activator
MDFRILGPLQVVVDIDPVDLGPPKQRALLAALVLHPNEIVPTDQIIEWLWAGEPPRTAQHSVQIYVSELRKLLANGDVSMIETRPPGYLLNVGPEAIDAARFEAMVDRSRALLHSGDPAAMAEMLRDALDLWHGRPLSDFGYEEFAQSHIRRLESMWLGAAEDLAAVELELGHVNAAILVLDDLVERAPLAEGPRRLQMLALYRAGRQVDALRTYRRFRSLLGDELGIEPSAGLQALEEQILLQDPALDPPAPGPVSVARGGRSSNPYKGLRAFEEADADNFFGREAMTAELVDRVRRGQRLVAVVGPSGSGKSSVVRAGLLPRLRHGAVDGSGDWLFATIMPGRHPFEELEAALHRVARTRGIDLGTSQAGLVRTALRLLPDDGSEFVLVIDQFEELFTLVDQQVRRSFLGALVNAVDGPHSRVRVVVTLRADFYDRPLVYPAFAPMFVDGAVTVTPLEAAELEAAVREPAAGAGVEVEPRLITQVVSDMVDQPGALPLLQYTLTELFGSRTGPVMTLDEYLRIGGLKGTLTTRAEEIFAAMTEGERELARQLFLRLVRVDKGGQSTRRRVPLAEVRSLGPDDGSVDEVIARLGNERLVVFDRDLLSGDATVEVTHEALLTGWTRMRDWIEQHRVDLQRREALGSAAADWEVAGRDPDYLLSGSRLATFEIWQEETSLRLAGHESNFVAASAQRRDALEAEERRRRRRGRRLRVGQYTLVGALAAVLAFFGPPALEPFFNPPPEVVLVIDEIGINDVGIGQLGVQGWHRAMADLDTDGQLRIRGVDEDGSALAASFARRGVGLLIYYFGNDFGPTVAVEHPETRFVVMQEVVDLPNVTSIIFAEHEGSFLVGAAAALTSETGVVGFIGGVDIPIIWRFQIGFEAGARFVRPDIEVEVEYLGHYFERAGFATPSSARRVAETMYRGGADVIFSAAGVSGQGTFDAAERLSGELGRHLWAIGVDADEYHSTRQLLDVEWPFWGTPWNVEAWPGHILTSMVKRTDNAIYQLVEEFTLGRLESGVRELGLAEEGVGYTTSGGHVDDIVPVLEDLKRRIISGEIVVPWCPEGRAEICAAVFGG